MVNEWEISVKVEEVTLTESLSWDNDSSLEKSLSFLMAKEALGRPDAGAAVEVPTAPKEPKRAVPSKTVSRNNPVGRHQ